LWANPALAAGSCATQSDASALKTAVMQQELMVAAFQCRETNAYNRFVTTFRGELQTSDAALKAFFIRRGGEHGEAGYDSFKTKAANLSALEQARNSAAFCADAHALYAAAFAHQGSLICQSRTTDAAISPSNPSNGPTIDQGRCAAQKHRSGSARRGLRKSAACRLTAFRPCRIGAIDCITAARGFAGRRADGPSYADEEFAAAAPALLRYSQPRLAAIRPGALRTPPGWTRAAAALWLVSARSLRKSLTTRRFSFPIIRIYASAPITRPLRYR
jgi:hypothetical protein